MTTQPRGVRVLGGGRWLRGLAVAGAAWAALPTPAAAQVRPAPTPGQPRPVAPPATDYDKRVVAYVHGNVPITREELGEFLIARGGMEKVELLVNRKVIEIEAHRRSVYATADEIGAGLKEDLRGAGAEKEAEFFQYVQQRFGKTRYEWEQDVIRPRILLGKMCRDRAVVSEDEVRRLYENRYGEKRRAQIIAYPNGQEPNAQVRQAACANPDDFVKLASTQPNAELAKSQGNTQPVGRFGENADPQVEQVLFGLQAGQISNWMQLKDGSWLCMKLLDVTPPDAAKPLEKVRGELEKELVDKKLNEAIPKFFAELKQAANPVLTQHVPLPPAPPPAEPGQPPPAPPVRAPEADPRVLARIYGTLPITREDLGEFLIARGGYEKLELLVNKKVIDLEAARRGATVTPQEIEAALKADVAGLPPRNDGQPLTVDEFVKHILPTYKKSLFEWNEDVIRPRLLLQKMCRDRVKVDIGDLQRAYENKFGEKRGAKIIIWPKDQLRLAQRQWDECRKGDEAFDRIARGQADGNLASRCGEVLPVGRYVDADNPAIEQALFGARPGDQGLQPGEVSGLIDTPAGVMCVKCTKIYPPAGNVSLEVARPGLEKEVFERKLAKEVPALFAELKRTANPNVLLKGPPTDRENAEGVKHLLQDLEAIKSGK
jgi:hypothetical protein